MVEKPGPKLDGLYADLCGGGGLSPEAQGLAEKEAPNGMLALMQHITNSSMGELRREMTEVKRVQCTRASR